MTALQDLMEFSPGVARVITRHEDLCQSLRPRVEWDPVVLRLRAVAAAEEALDRDDPAWIRRELRRLKYEVCAGLILADAAIGPDAVPAVTAALADLADAVTAGALRWAQGRLVTRHGPPEGWPKDGGCCVLALGKHGAGELNYSSDIDVVLVVADHQGVTTGARPIDTRRFADRLAAELIGCLSEPTEDGFCFRVDLDLRPDGVTASPTTTLAAAEDHYLLFGRTWERAAWMKARACAGDLGMGGELLRRLGPFLWRRSIDFHTLGDIAGLRDRIGQAAQADGARRDLKRGTGGIREVEFIVQAPQLVWAGRDPSLRVRGTVAGIRALETKGILAEGTDADALLAAWRLLRAVEHRLQWPEEAQTQRLPQDDDSRSWEALARRLPQAGGVQGLRRWLESARTTVSADWERLMLRSEPERRSGPAMSLALMDARRRAKVMVDPFLPADEGVQVLSGLGFPNAEACAAKVQRLIADARAGRMGEAGWRRFERVLPILLSATAGTADPSAVLDALGELVSRSGARGATWALLDESPAAAETLIRLFDGAPFLGERFLRHPELLDALVLRGRGGERPPRDAPGLWTELAADLALRWDDDERLASLRTFQTVELIRIALHDLSGSLPDPILGPPLPQPHLTALARTVVRGAMATAELGMAGRHGRLRQEDGESVPLAVLGLGSLGSGWMGYGSDVDLVFLHGARGGAISDGPRPLEAGTWAARFAQRVITALSAQTPEGRCHEVDLRLRTDGSAGPIAVSLEAFASYHLGVARPWELIALQRASVAATTDPGFGASVTAALGPLRCRGPESRGRLAQEALEMRNRQLANRAGEGATQVDLKLGPGGLTDLEFAVACLQGSSVPGTLGGDQPDPAAALVDLTQAGQIEPAVGTDLLETWFLFRKLESAVRRRRGTSVAGISRAEVERAGGSWAELLARKATCARWVQRVLG